MTRNAWLGLNVCLLAAVLLDASAARTSVAEEGHAKSDQKSEHQPAHNPEGGEDEHGPAEGDHHSTRPDGHDHDRADTHVSFEPNGPTRRDAAKDVRDKLRSFTHGNLRQHRLLAPPAGGVARNAIGVTLPPHEVGQRNSDGRSWARGRAGAWHRCERPQCQTIERFPSGSRAARRCSAGKLRDHCRHRHDQARYQLVRNRRTCKGRCGNQRKQNQAPLLNSG